MDSVKPSTSNAIATKKSPEASSGHGVERETWNGSWSFMLAALGAAIGLGAVIRFPYLAFRYGGAAFLIPYIIFLFVLGIPLLALEFSLGQRMRFGPVGAMAKIQPRAWAIGMWAAISAFLMMVTYNVIMSWTWVFLVYSFQAVLPWGTSLESAQTFFAETVQGQVPGSCATNLECGLGGFQWKLVLGLLFQYILVFFAIFKGTKLVGKIVWFTVPTPVIMVVILLIYSLTLEGAHDGITAYIGRLDTSHLADGSAWVDAAGQIFYGLSLACGSMIAYGSSQAIDRPVNMPAWFVGIGNSVYSFMGGFAMFGVMGYLANDMNVHMDDMGDHVGGFQISFVSFPTAINLLPAGVSHFFAVFFFLFLLFLGIDSSMALAEAVTITLRDHVPFFRSRPGVTAGMTCSAAFLLGLVMCTEGGEAVMDIMDHYTANYCVLLIGLFECLSVWAYEYNGAAVGWTKGKQKSWRDVVFSSRLEQEMLKFTGQSLKWLPFYWSFLVKFIAPVLITTLFAIMVYEDSIAVYGGYPIWATVVFGWVLCVILPIGAVIVGTFFPMHLDEPYIGQADSMEDDFDTTKAPPMKEGGPPAMYRQNSVQV